MSFTQRLAECATRIEARLADLFVTGPAAAAPNRINAAMRHGLLGGGKRLRPFLLIESARLFAVPPERSIDAAAAIECIHCYSLIHDDLPAMDNDTLRRGQPTVWAAFDEWTAILAGDGLLTLAFELLADSGSHADPVTRCQLITALARAAGAAGMVGGQALDLGWEKLDHASPPEADDIRQLQMLKTGALISASCEMGAILGQADPDAHAALRRYGQSLGYAFQIADDLLDAEGTAAATGKAVAKDQALGKATLVGIWGAPRCREILDELVNDCIEALQPFGTRGNVLAETAHFVATRDR